MRNSFTRKLNNKQGVTIILVLMYLLVALVTAAVVTTAAVSNASKTENRLYAEQGYQQAAGVIEVMQKQFKDAKLQYNITDKPTVTDPGTVFCSGAILTWAKQVASGQTTSGANTYSVSFGNYSGSKTDKVQAAMGRTSVSIVLKPMDANYSMLGEIRVTRADDASKLLYKQSFRIIGKKKKITDKYKGNNPDTTGGAIWEDPASDRHGASGREYYIVEWNKVELL